MRDRATPLVVDDTDQASTDHAHSSHSQAPGGIADNDPQLAQ
ncbi:hypothetical protein [Actinocatenispora comari]|jgi:hypothetical protein|nr:hypothetical protein [Actinocatenispora comari]